MPLQALAQIENNFTRGLITEATGLNFPENACTETFDCVFHENAKVDRRLGFDYEEDYQFDPVTRDTNNYVVQEFIWDDVAGLGDLSFVVIQIGKILHFWQVNEQGSLSSQKKSFTIDLSAGARVVGAPEVGVQPCQFAAGNGLLVVVHPYCKPFYLTYDRSSDSITSTFFNLKIRDLIGIDDGFDDNYRPKKTGEDAAAINQHHYNLLNQGWYPDVPTKSESGNQDVLAYWLAHRSDYPSNADIWWLLKNTSSLYDLTLINTIPRGLTAAPKGHYILVPYYQDRHATSGIGLASYNTITSGYYRPSTVAFHNSRAFFAGVTGKNTHNHIYFTQQLDENNHFDRCYQQADPTTEDSVGLLPTDGGEIVITEAGQIIKLLPVQGLLLAFCTNGLWAISGNQQFGFTANDYTVFQVSGIRSLSASSFVIPKDGLPIWWNADGIFTIKFNQQTYNIQQSIEVQSLTDTTLKLFYNNIPSTSKRYAKGAYNPLGNLVQWVYNSAEPDSVLDNYDYDRVLVLNLNSGAFYPWTISQIINGPKVHGILSSRGRGVIDLIETVVDTNGNIVQDASLDNVTDETFTNVPLTSDFSYTTSVISSAPTYNITFAKVRDESYKDWSTFNPTNYDSYFITGYKTHGQAQRQFQINSIFVYFEFLDGASCFLQGIWDFANDDSSGRYTSNYQVVSNRSFYGIQRRRVRLRGRGYSLQLKFISEEGKPFRLHGWSSFETQPQTP